MNTLLVLAQLYASLTLLNTKSYIAKEAEIKGINPSLALCIVTHESNFNENAKGDDKGSSYSRSWWQISNKWHPEVSDETAYSLEKSTEWALERIKEGYVNEWSTRKTYCSKVPVFLQP